MVKRTLEGNNYHYRIRDPRLFKKDTFITLDVGDSGKHQLIRGRLKKNNQWKTQAILVEKELDRQLKPQTNRMIRQAQAE